MVFISWVGVSTDMGLRFPVTNRRERSAGARVAIGEEGATPVQAKFDSLEEFARRLGNGSSSTGLWRTSAS